MRQNMIWLFHNETEHKYASMWWYDSFIMRQNSFLFTFTCAAWLIYVCAHTCVTSTQYASMWYHMCGMSSVSTGKSDLHIVRLMCGMSSVSVISHEGVLSSDHTYEVTHIDEACCTCECEEARVMSHPHIVRLHVIWPIHARDMTRFSSHSHVRYDSFMCGTPTSYVFMWYDIFTCAVWRIHVRDPHIVCLHVIWPIHARDMTRFSSYSHVRETWLVSRETWLVSLHIVSLLFQLFTFTDMTCFSSHSHVRHDSFLFTFTCVSRET